MLANKEGQKVPAVTFRLRESNDWVSRSSDALFANKTVIVFSLPGAFTPTCSSSHVPRFNQLAPYFKAHGVDDIICLSVNDAFVMNAWQKEQHAEHIHFIADGNGAFTEGMGLLVDKDDLGFGKRSWRYSMLVRNGVIEKMFIEPDQPGDPFEVSDADTLFEYLYGDAEKPLDVTLLTREGCPFCAKAKALLAERGIEYEALELNQDYSYRSLRALAAADSYPQVFINGEKIGGCDDLEDWLKNR